MTDISLTAVTSRLALSFRTARAGLLGSGIAALAAIATPAHAEPANRSLETLHQPVVQRTDFVFDVAADTSGGLSTAERTRMLGWFKAIDIGFGDRVAIVESSGYPASAMEDAIATEVARYGLLVSDQAPQTAGMAPAGSVRIVISRATASVPSCPDWNDRSEPNLRGGLSHNYGCATSSNLAAMVADPQDLVEGRSTHTVLRTATSSRAIKAYSEQPPTGANGGLKVEATGGR